MANLIVTRGTIRRTNHDTNEVEVYEPGDMITVTDKEVDRLLRLGVATKATANVESTVIDSAGEDDTESKAEIKKNKKTKK